MKLSIIIVSWNTSALLEKCLASVYAYPPADPFEVWVVDNASTDDSAAMVESYFPQVHLVTNANNVGFARANNQAIPHCTGEYILLLNPDTEVKAKALPTLSAWLDAHPEAGGVGPFLLNPDGTLQTSCYPAPTLMREFWRLLHLDWLTPYGSYNMARWDTHTPREVDVLQGACLLVRRMVLEKVGVLDETYFIYSEEVDLCYRIRRAGWSLWWEPQSQVVHYGGQSTRQVKTEMFLRLYQGKVLYFRKHYGPITTFLYKIILFVTALPRLLLVLPAWVSPPEQRRNYLEVAGHYRKLIAALPNL